MNDSSILTERDTLVHNEFKKWHKSENQFFVEKWKTHEKCPSSVPFVGVALGISYPEKCMLEMITDPSWIS